MSALRTLASGTLLTHEIEIKRSRFITTLARTDTPEEARELIDAVKAEHPQARHNCSAYLIDPPDAAPLQHSSDDGEPSGTAGTPMLEALRASDTWNATAVVTRYFGGILLGGGGLVRAYSTSVSEAVARAPIAYLVGRDVLETQLNPADAGRIEAEPRSSTRSGARTSRCASRSIRATETRLTHAWPRPRPVLQSFATWKHDELN